MLCTLNNLGSLYLNIYSLTIGLYNKSLGVHSLYTTRLDALY